MSFNPLDPTIRKKLDPEFVKYYENVLDTRPATHQVPLEEIRNNPVKWAAPWTVPITQNETIETRTITTKDGHAIPIRIYHPDPEKFGPGPYGVHLNYHGKHC